MNPWLGTFRCCFRLCFGSTVLVVSHQHDSWISLTVRGISGISIEWVIIIIPLTTLLEGERPTFSTLEWEDVSFISHISSSGYTRADLNPRRRTVKSKRNPFQNVFDCSWWIILKLRRSRWVINFRKAHTHIDAWRTCCCIFFKCDWNQDDDKEQGQLRCSSHLTC